jgi:hypothetical protein
MESIFEELMSVFDGAPLYDEDCMRVIEETNPIVTNDEPATSAAAVAVAPRQDSVTEMNERVIIRAPFTAERLDHYEHDAIYLNANIPHDTFGEIKPTTFGLTGYMSGISFNEDKFINNVRKTIEYPCVRVICNYGVAYSANYEQLVADGRISLVSEQKAARARNKKIDRRIKPRKVQGSGCCFNSSLLIWLYSERYGAVYKVLLFRTGNFNLPGTLPDRIHDVIHLINDALIPMLNRAKINAQDATVSNIVIPAPSIEYLLPIMKDYKWERILNEGESLNLSAIHAKLLIPLTDRSQLFEIGQIYHEMCDSKISIKCNIIAYPDKHVRVKIFARGRINILGACDSNVTKKICEFVVNLITNDVIMRDDAPVHAAAINYYNSDDDDQYALSRHNAATLEEASAVSSDAPHVALFY